MKPKEIDRISSKPSLGGAIDPPKALEEPEEHEMPPVDTNRETIPMPTSPPPVSSRREQFISQE